MFGYVILKISFLLLYVFLQVSFHFFFYTSQQKVSCLHILIFSLFILFFSSVKLSFHLAFFDQAPTILTLINFSSLFSSYPSFQERLNSCSSNYYWKQVSRVFWDISLSKFPSISLGLFLSYSIFSPCPTHCGDIGLDSDPGSLHCLHRDLSVSWL